MTSRYQLRNENKREEKKETHAIQTYNENNPSMCKKKKISEIIHLSFTYLPPPFLPIDPRPSPVEREKDKVNNGEEKAIYIQSDAGKEKE